MVDQTQPTEPVETSANHPTARRPYHKPEFRHYGAVADLTRNEPPIAPSGDDGGKEIPYEYVNSAS